jgi:hypothetical protein
MSNPTDTGDTAMNINDAATVIRRAIDHDPEVMDALTLIWREAIDKGTERATEKRAQHLATEAHPWTAYSVAADAGFFTALVDLSGTLKVYIGVDTDGYVDAIGNAAMGK